MKNTSDKFEEQFPSLEKCSMIEDEGDWETYPMDMGELSGYSINDIQKHCLDKQRVKKVLKANLTQWDYLLVFDALGLEE